MKQSNLRYVLPNSMTTIATMAGFYSIIMAIKGQFDLAFIAIFIAFFADGFDGKIARFFNAQSNFGSELDSLSDMAAFGIAPAIIIYCWSLSYLGHFSWIIACLYTISTAFRLARFNTLKVNNDQKWFKGLPCPMAACTLASFIWLCVKYNTSGLSVSVPLACFTLLLSVLMISNISYHSMRKFSSKTKTVGMVSTGLIIFAIAVIMNLPELCFGEFFIYMISGPIGALFSKRT